VKYLLDTDTFSVLARGRHAALDDRVRDVGLPSLAISVVTEGEVRYGQACARLPRTLADRIEALLEGLQRLPLDSSVVAPYAALRATLRRKGQPIGPNDAWIAAHAIARQLVLVTNNEREFKRVPGLKVENWLR